MAIIVNKEEKRRNIALSCQTLLLENGIENLTVAQIAKTAGVGKGTIYEYFSNKEDIVFEIISTFIVIHEERLEEICSERMPLKQKLFHFFNLLFESEESRRHLVLYKEFLAISLLQGSEEMLHFSEVCRQRFQQILDRMLSIAVESGEIPPSHTLDSHALLLFATGLVIDSRLQSVQPEKEIERFLQMILGEHVCI